MPENVNNASDLKSKKIDAKAGFKKMNFGGALLKKMMSRFQSALQDKVIEKKKQNEAKEMWKKVTAKLID